MSVIAIFYNIIITMYAGDTPHFHAKYQEHEAEYDFEGNILKGSMPPGKRKIIASWAEIHKEDLQANWDICRAGLSPMKIEPLRL